jgi:citrate synthase
MTDAYLSADEAAAYLGVSRPTLYAYVSRGLVASEPTEGRARRYPRRALDAFRARREAPRDPSLATESAISLIDGERLWYRGRDACELSRTATLEEVAALLWATGGEVAFPPSRGAGGGNGSHPERLAAALVRERRRHPLSLTEPDQTTYRVAAATVAALFDAAGARGPGTLAQRLARGWNVASSADDVRAALVLCADHGLAASTFTARCVASTDAPLPNALLAALCALEGRRHGGVATGEIADLLDDVARLGVRRACERVLAQRGRLPGFFGATSVYRDGDPRALELLARLRLPRRDPAIQTIEFARSFGGTPSIELALSAFARRAGLARDAPFALFALGRSVGWVAHAFEAAARGVLIRPRATYVGPRPS